MRQRFESLAQAAATHPDLDAAKKQALVDAARELRDAAVPYETDRSSLVVSLESFADQYGQALPETTESQQAARQAFDPIAEASRGLIKQVDLLYSSPLMWLTSAGRTRSCPLRLAKMTGNVWGEPWSSSVGKPSGWRARSLN